MQAAAPPQAQSTLAAPPAPRAPAKTGDSLLGFDFFGNHTQQGVSGRPASAAASIPTSTAPSRPDLKQSILSLYASSSRTPTPSQSAQAVAPAPPRPTSGFADLSSDFGSLNFGAPPQSSSTATFSNKNAQSQGQMTPKPLSGGSFFDSRPLAGSSGAPLPRPAGRPRELSTSSGFGAFESATSPGWGDSPDQAKQTSSPKSHGDLFDLGGPSPPPKTSCTSTGFESAFNLSAPKPTPKLPQQAPIANTSSAVLDDPWGSNDAWSTPAQSTPAAPEIPRPPPKAPAPGPVVSNSDDWGWGNSGISAPAPPPVPVKSGEVTGDEDFGGWESFPAATTPAASASQATKPTAGGNAKPFASNDADLFSNVWG